MSECEVKLGNWGFLNPLRDGMCTLMSIPTVPTPTPPVEEEAPAPRKPREAMPLGEGLVFLFSPEVLPANWRYVLSSFSPALIGLAISVAPIAADLAHKQMKKLGWVS